MGNRGYWRQDPPTGFPPEIRGRRERCRRERSSEARRRSSSWCCRRRGRLGPLRHAGRAGRHLAREALAKGDVKIVLPWVAAEKEGEIRQAFDLAVAVRDKGAKEKELADRYFFETLVRIHREGEGAPYTGPEARRAGPGPRDPRGGQSAGDRRPGPAAQADQREGPRGDPQVLHGGAGEEGPRRPQRGSGPGLRPGVRPVPAFRGEALQRRHHPDRPRHGRGRRPRGPRRPASGAGVGGAPRALTAMFAGDLRRGTEGRDAVPDPGGRSRGDRSGEDDPERETDAEIVIATDETDAPYLRPLLPDLILGEATGRDDPGPARCGPCGERACGW